MRGERHGRIGDRGSAEGGNPSLSLSSFLCQIRVLAGACREVPSGLVNMPL